MTCGSSASESFGKKKRADDSEKRHKNYFKGLTVRGGERSEFIRGEDGDFLFKVWKFLHWDIIQGNNILFD